VEPRRIDLRTRTSAKDRKLRNGQLLTSQGRRSERMRFHVSRKRSEKIRSFFGSTNPGAPPDAQSEEMGGFLAREGWSKDSPLEQNQRDEGARILKYHLV